MSKKKRESSSSKASSPEGSESAGGKPSRKESKESGGKLVDLLVQGDNRAARALAREILANPQSTEADRTAATDALSRTGFDGGALSAVGVGFSVLLVIVALLYLS